MSLGKDGIANKNMKGLDSHPSFTVSLGAGSGLLPPRSPPSHSRESRPHPFCRTRWPGVAAGSLSLRPHRPLAAGPFPLRQTQMGERNAGSLDGQSRGAGTAPAEGTTRVLRTEDRKSIESSRMQHFTQACYASIFNQQFWLGPY